jgi:HSP90 family molecular chaperone
LDDVGNRQKLTELLRFPSTKSETIDPRSMHPPLPPDAKPPLKPVSLKEYVSRMQPNQKNIYYVTGESVEAAKQSPFLEELQARDLEVLFFTDAIDEYIIPHLQEYEGKKFVSINREGLDLGDEEEWKKESEILQKKFEPLMKLFKNLYEKDIVKADVSNRLNKSPLVVVASKYGLSANMERIIRAQALGDDEGPNSHLLRAPSRILELNPKHQIIVTLNERVAAQSPTGVVAEVDQTTREMAQLLYETASFRSGYSVKNPDIYGDKVYELLTNLAKYEQHHQPDVRRQQQQKATTDKATTTSEIKEEL